MAILDGGAHTAQEAVSVRARRVSRPAEVDRRCLFALRHMGFATKIPVRRCRRVVAVRSPIGLSSSTVMRPISRDEADTTDACKRAVSRIIA